MGGPNTQKQHPVTRRPSSQRAIRFADEKQRRSSAGVLRRSSRLKILEQTLVFEDVAEGANEDDDDNNSLDSEDSLDQAALAFWGFGGGFDPENDQDMQDNSDNSFDSFVWANGGNCNHRGSLLEDLSGKSASLDEIMAIDLRALNTSRSRMSFSEKEMLGAMLQENMTAIQENEETRMELEAELEALKERASLQAAEALASGDVAVKTEWQAKRAEIMAVGNPTKAAQKLEQEIREIQQSSLVSSHLSEILRRTLAILTMQKMVRGFLVRSHMQSVLKQAQQLEQALVEIRLDKTQELRRIANDPELYQVQQEWKDWLTKKEQMAKEQPPLSQKDELLKWIEHQNDMKERHTHNITAMERSNAECQVTLDFIQTELENIQKRHARLEEEYKTASKQLDKLEVEWDELETHIAAVQEGRRAEKRKVSRTKKAFTALVKIIQESDSKDPYVRKMKRRALILERMKDQYRHEKLKDAETAAAKAAAAIPEEHEQKMEDHHQDEDESEEQLQRSLTAFCEVATKLEPI